VSGGRRAVALDVDGVLLDSAAAHQAVWRQWAQSRRLAVAEVLTASTGRRPDDVIREVAPHLDPVTERRALDALTRASPAVVGPMPGAAELLGSLPVGCWAIVTSGSAWYVRGMFGRHRLPLPAIQVYAEDVAQAKPAPDGYLLASLRLGVAPGDCLVIDDSLPGVIAGQAAGCPVVGFALPEPARALADHLAGTLTDVMDMAHSWLRGESLSREGAQ
jgi:mannitol-1-/sugar-/sorbitol-6-phosphatase